MDHERLNPPQCAGRSVLCRSIASSASASRLAARPRKPQASLAEQLRRGKIGIGARGVALGLINQPAVPERSAVVGVEADRVVEVRNRPVVIIFLQIRKASLRVVVGNCVIIPQALAAADRRRIGARPELDGLAAIDQRAIVIALQIVDDAAVVECIGVFLVDLDCLAIVGEREIVLLLRPPLDAAIHILAGQVAPLVAARLDGARTCLDGDFAALLGADLGFIGRPAFQRTCQQTWPDYDDNPGTVAPKSPTHDSTLPGSVLQDRQRIACWT